MIRRKLHILSNGPKFSAGRPLLPACNFSGTMSTIHTTYRFGAVASLKFLLIENMIPPLLVHVYYGIMAGWIRIPRGLEVRLGPGDIVLDGDSPPPWKGAQRTPLFGPLLFPTSLQAQILPITHMSSRLGSAWQAAIVSIVPELPPV